MGAMDPSGLHSPPTTRSDLLSGSCPTFSETCAGEAKYSQPLIHLNTWRVFRCPYFSGNVEKLSFL